MKPVLLFFFTIIASSCLYLRTPEQHFPACYGVEFNPTRAVLGISLLKADWVAKDSTETVTVWRPVVKKDKPCHSSKVIRYYNGTLGWETDNYFSNKKYTTEDGTSFESLVVWFYYISSKYNENRSKEDPKEGEVGFIYEYSHCHKSGLFTTRDRITKSQADSLLISWGLGDEIVPLQTEK